MIEVVQAGHFTTVQDLPGRVGYWHVGVPPSGPMDSLSHALVNRVAGNAASAATFECTGTGPVLRFLDDTVCALGGAGCDARLDGAPVLAWTPIVARAGAILDVGSCTGGGQRIYLAVRGGIGSAPYLGSRSTFTLGGFGGHRGRALVAGDVLAIGGDAERAPAALAPGLAPCIEREHELAVTIGPHAAPEYLTERGLATFLSTPWRVHHNSSRTGVRLIGPAPGWARDDGGEAGLHPSNIHDTGYSIGAVDLTGDMPVILGPDGPSLGGFVCPAVVIAADRWKLGQMAPGDTVRLRPVAVKTAESRSRATRCFVARATERVEPVARPPWCATMPPPTGADPAVAARSAIDSDEVIYRRAGDRFVLVEFGPMVLDLGLRMKAHACARWIGDNMLHGVIDVTVGVRSVLIQVDGEARTVGTTVHELLAAGSAPWAGASAPVSSRVVHLPLCWDDPSTRLAIERYMAGVRADAPWCPSNIEFIRRINGLDSVEEVQRIVYEASYLVLGLGDVYLGAPVATPLDPRHRLVTTKYNPARTWTPENAVGIGGAYLCIYGMEGPGGYQFVGRTVQVWNTDQRGPHFAEPWLLRPFDQLRFYPVAADELVELREIQARGELELKIEEETFSLEEYERFLDDNREGIERFARRQRAAFAAERDAWSAR